MTRRFVTGALVGALATVFAGGAAAQADPKNSGYWLFGYGTPEANVWRNSNFNDPKIGNLCWRTGFWAPSMAIMACDPDLVPNPPAPTPIFIGTTLKQMFETDKKDEEQAIAMYKKIIEVARKEGDETTEFLFTKILSDEEEHHDLFSSLHEKD